jgi:hypothetical protein
MYQKVPDGMLEDHHDNRIAGGGSSKHVPESQTKKNKKMLALHIAHSKSYTENSTDDNDDDDDDDSSVSSRDMNEETDETNSLVSPGKSNESIFRIVVAPSSSSSSFAVVDDSVISRKKSGDQSLTGSQHNYHMPTSRNNSSLLDDDELGDDFASDWDDDEINLSRYNHAMYYSSTNGRSSNSNSTNHPFQIARDVPLPVEFDHSSIPQRLRRWWYLALTHWNGMRHSARQRRAARLLSLPSETHRAYVCILTVCCDATDIGIAVAAASVLAWIVVGGLAKMGSGYWMLGLTLFVIRISARRCYDSAIAWWMNSTAARRVRRLRTSSHIRHHHHPVANTDDDNEHISHPPPKLDYSSNNNNNNNNNRRGGRPHVDTGMSGKHGGDATKAAEAAASPNRPTPVSV